MLTRQKIILALLEKTGKPLSPTKFVKLMFLLRNETFLEKDSTFYDFVPYKFGPFSFALYRELGSLRQYGYVVPEENRIMLSGSTQNLSNDLIQELPRPIHEAISFIISRYGRMKQENLIRSVYGRYPWYAINSELPERHLIKCQSLPKAQLAVYTAGYEGESVDAFFDRLLRRGIRMVIDVRANPISRKYGFSHRRFNEISDKLGLDYAHVPSLGISSSARANLTTFASYQRLLDKYEKTNLPKHTAEVEAVGCLMHKKPAVLVCVEKDFHCCHRSRLAESVAKVTGLEVLHL